MSTEELQLILTMAQQAGEGAFALACIYLVVGFFKAMLSPGVWLVFFILAYKGSKYTIDKLTAKKNSLVERRIEARLAWAKAQYPRLTEDATREFVRGKANKIDTE